MPAVDVNCDANEPSMNVAVLRGVVRGDPVIRELASGDTVAQFDLVTTGAAARLTVPVAWPEPQSSSSSWLVEGTDVVVVGVVRRRFFRVGAATRSRTEVVADSVVPARRRARVTAALTEALARIAAP
jgi:single-strand DNA-binding protein